MDLSGKFCPKVKHHGLKALNATHAIAEFAVCTFNDGATALGKVLRELQIDTSMFTKALFSCQKKKKKKLACFHKQISLIQTLQVGIMIS